jgi:hypothetical protein
MNINAEHTVSGRRCGHCGQIGHIQTHCRRAQNEGHNYHLRILNVLRNIPDNNNIPILRRILNNMTIKQLKLIMYTLGIEGPNTAFIRSLENGGIISRETSFLRLKQDRVTVLILFYQNLSIPVTQLHTLNNVDEDVFEPRKLLVEVKLLNTNTDSNASTFDCPICLNPNEIKEKVISNCNHIVCKPCLVNYIDHLIQNSTSKKPCCSLCRANITSISFENNEYMMEVSNKYFIDPIDCLFLN